LQNASASDSPPRMPGDTHSEDHRGLFAGFMGDKGLSPILYRKDWLFSQVFGRVSYHLVPS